MRNKNFRGKIVANVSSWEDSILDTISNRGRKNNRNREGGFPAFYSWADLVDPRLINYKRISKTVIRRRMSSD